MDDTDLPARPSRWLERLAARCGGALSGSAFPAFLLSVLALGTLLVAGLLLVPASESGLGAFARDFRTWCLGQDPASGRFEWAQLATVLTGPLMLGGTAVLVWWEPLRRALARGPRAFVLPVAAAAAVVGACAAGMVSLAPEPELAFPAESLRTSTPPPAFSLTAHDGTRLELDELRGDVVLLTSVYARCSTACPMILAQSRRAVEALDPSEREDLRVVAITMDPEHDTPERLSELAAARGLEAPHWRLVTGEPSEVDAVLDRLGVARERDPETGVIDHANLFVLLDRRGLIAYRFTLGELQERWLVEALHLLLAEPGPSA